jgi:hypothetical protein
MTLRLLLVAGLLLSLPSCVRMEGDLANECIDHADNDRDGLYDCDDPDCFGSPDCSGDDDDTGAQPDDDDTGDGDDDTQADDDDTGSQPDDDDTAGIERSFSGTIDLMLVSTDWQTLELPCEGPLTAVLDAQGDDLVGSGSCLVEDPWMGQYEFPLEFAADVGPSSVDGSGTIYLDKATQGWFDDTPLTVAGTHDGHSFDASVSSVESPHTDMVLISGSMNLSED